MSELLVTAEAVRTAAGVLGDAVLIRDGTVAAVGDAATLRSPGRAERGYGGAAIVPGLRDAHFHPVTYAAAVTGVSLKTAVDFVDIGERLGAAASGLRPGAALTAIRLDDERLAEGRLPTRHDLDGMVGDRPVLVHRYCGHIAVVNTAALDLAGVGLDTADPAGGSLDRDDEGRPTGVLRETGITLVNRAVAAAAPLELGPGQLLGAMHGLSSVGLTSIGAMLGCGDGTWAELGDEAARLAEIATDLPLKIHAFVIASTPGQLEAAAAALEDVGPRLRFAGLKAFSDGSLGGHTAAMHQPFADRPDRLGTLRLDPAWGREMARAALGMGGGVAVHAIGDRANARVLDLFTELLEGGADPADLRVEHASILGDAEIDRFAATGVTASVQPAFLPSETGWLHKRLGAERMRSAYPFRTLWERGVPLAGGSDCPVEPPYPLAGLAAARDRAGIMPAEGLDSDAALGIFTDGAAASVGEPAPLAVGSPADFVVLDTDPVAATPDEVRGAAVLATWIDGAPVTVPEGLVTWAD